MSLLNHLTQQVGSVFFLRQIPPTEDWPLLGSKLHKSGAHAVLLESCCDIERLRSFKQFLNLTLIIRVTPDQLNTSKDVSAFSSADILEVLIRKQEDLELLTQLTWSSDHAYILCKNVQIQSLEAFHKILMGLALPAYFEFSNYNSKDPSTFSVHQVYELIQNFYQKFGFICLPPPGRDIWDHSISPNLQLEPLTKITFQSGQFDRVEHSIIIPTYNSRHYLMNVVKHLANQDMPQEKYEIIIVDDGSSDGSQEYVQNMFSRHFERLNLKYIYFPRPVARKRGDSYFRAGLSRNLGFHYAVGSRLSFLDSDILVPPNFLTETRDLLKKYDLIQHTRFHIRPEDSNEYIEFSKVDLKKQTFIEEENYWKPFFDAQTWTDLDTYWKYTCTYCLTLNREDFVQVGRFRRTFVSYGFEDTDLGYRFALANKRFHLSKNYTLHLTPNKTQSEYQHSQFIRHTLLSKTAKKFFLNHLDPKIFEHFQIYMGGEYPKIRKVRLFLGI